MPTYDYKCNACDKIFEYFQPMKDEPLKECLCSKKGEVTRLISGGTGIIFKGTGFYVTDYKKTGTPVENTSPVTTTPASTPATTPTLTTDKS